MIAVRMAAYDMSQLEQKNVYGNSIIGGSAQVHQGDVYLTNYYTYQNGHAAAPLNTRPGNVDAFSPTEDSVQRNARGFAFEELLMNSRAYRSAAHNNTDAFSVISSAGRTATWSMLSGLSLSEMSNIAILAIPVYATDLNDKEGYDFEPPRTEATIDQPYLAQSSSQSPGSTRSKRSVKDWWKQIHKTPGTGLQLDSASTDRIFAVALRESIIHANVTILLRNDDEESSIFGYIPVIVAKCCIFLKEKGK